MYVAPLFYAPLSEYFGRKDIIHASNMLFLPASAAGACSRRHR